MNKGKRKAAKIALAFAASLVFSLCCCLVMLHLLGQINGTGIRDLLLFHAALLFIGLCAASHSATAGTSKRMGYLEARAWLSGFLLIPGAVVVLAVIVFTRSFELAPICLAAVGMVTVSAAYRKMDKLFRADQEVIAYFAARQTKKK